MQGQCQRRQSARCLRQPAKMACVPTLLLHCPALAFGRTWQPARNPHPAPLILQALNPDTVTLDAAQLTGNGQVVTASWSLGTSGAHSSDTIALYLAPVSATFDTAYPIKYKKAGTASGSARWARALTGGTLRGCMP